MTDIAEIIRRNRANSCVECGKCSAACPMPAMYPDFSISISPRALVQNTLRRHRGLTDQVPVEGLRHCLQCGNCSQSCPEGVDCAGLIALLREDARRTGEGGFNYCAGCGREIMAEPAQQWLAAMLGLDTAPEQDRLPSFLEKFIAEQDEPQTKRGSRDLLCAVCRRQAYAAGNG